MPNAADTNAEYSSQRRPIAFAAAPTGTAHRKISEPERNSRPELGSERSLLEGPRPRCAKPIAIRVSVPPRVSDAYPPHHKHSQGGSNARVHACPTPADSCAPHPAPHRTRGVNEPPNPENRPLADEGVGGRSPVRAETPISRCCNSAIRAFQDRNSPPLFPPIVPVVHLLWRWLHAACRALSSNPRSPWLRLCASILLRPLVGLHQVPLSDCRRGDI
jgi:hypothetical protein